MTDEMQGQEGPRLSDVKATWLPVPAPMFEMVGDMPPLFAALCQAQGIFPEIAKENTADAGKYKYDYADLADVLKAIRPGLAANGLCLMQPIDGGTEKGYTIRTILAHTSGAYISSRVVVPFISDSQEFGKKVTYSRRYSVLSMLSIFPGGEDDDASHPGTTVERKAPQARQEAPRRGPPPLPVQAAKPAPAKEEPARNGRTVVEMPIEAQRQETVSRAAEAAALVGDPTTQVDPPPDGPATPATKLGIRVAMLALGYKGPDVMRKLASLFGPGVKPDQVDTEAKSVKLLDALHADIDLIPGLVNRLPEIEAEQRKLVSS